MRSRVSLIAAQNYESASVRRAVDEAIAAAGGLARVKPGDRAFVKINHLGHHALESAIVTHPEFSAAVACHLKDLGARVTVGDGLEKEGDDYFVDSGYIEAAKRCGLELINLKGGKYVNITTKSGTTLAVAARALETDHFINVPKLKTHALTVMTCAVKNLYGLLPQYLRRNLHREHVVPREFSRAVVDIYEAVKPAFHVVDAITGLEGSGPSTGGKPRQIGLIIAGSDGVAVDAVSAAIMGLNPLDVSTTSIAAQRELGIADLRQIEIAGVPLADAIVPDFVLPGSLAQLANIVDRLPRPMARLLGGLIGLTKEIPRIQPKNCVACGLCRAHCPQGAIQIEKIAIIDYKKCISCFCCQEFCQSDAVGLSHSIAGELIIKSANMLRKITKGVRKRKLS